MNLNESIREALEDQEVQDAIKNCIDELASSRASELSQAVLEQKMKELGDSCEEYKSQISKDSEARLTEAVNKKIAELDHCCEEYKAELDKAYECRISELTETLSEYVDDVVEEFVQEHREQFTVNEDRMKVDAILEGLSAVCAIAGVRAEQITQGCKYLSEKEQIVKDQRIENLKSKIRLQEQNRIELEKENGEIQQESIRLKKELANTHQDYKEAASESESEKQKNQELEEALKEYVRKNKISESENEQAKRKNQELREKLSDCTGKIEELEAKITELNSAVTESRNTAAQEIRKMSAEIAALRKTNESLESEKSHILKMGVISEMKQGMTLTEAKRFEQIAEHIPFEQTQEYFDKLEVLKDELLNNPKYKKLNEVTGNEEPQESEETETDSESSRWDHLI